MMMMMMIINIFLPFDEKFGAGFLKDVMNVQIKRKYFVHRRHLIVPSKGNPKVRFFIM